MTDSTNNDYVDTPDERPVCSVDNEVFSEKFSFQQKYFWFATSVSKKRDQCVLSTLKGMILYAI